MARVKFRVELRDVSMRGKVRAPQYGYPKLKAREIRVDRRRITQAELEELAKLMQEIK
jgi:hypothetical protein